MMTYGEVMSMVRAFFLSRWGDVISNPSLIFNHINCALQDIYNADDWAAKYVNEVVSGVKDGLYTKYNLSHPISKLNMATEILGSSASWREYTVTLEQQCECDCSIYMGDNYLYIKSITDTPTQIDVSYIKDYQWATFDADLDKPIPLPDKFIPALIKLTYDWASPINLMQSEAQANDFFSHAANRLNQLKQIDWVTNRFTYSS